MTEKKRTSNSTKEETRITEVEEKKKLKDKRKMGKKNEEVEGNGK
jgi:hypothetical protein